MKDYVLFENQEKFNFKGRSAFVNEWLILDFTASGFEFTADFNNSDVQIHANIIEAYSKNEAVWYRKRQNRI